jgi:hypothetical protein
MTFWKKLQLSGRSYSWLWGTNCQISRLFRDNCSVNRRHDPQEVIPQLLKGKSVIQLPETVQKDYTNYMNSPDINGVNYARPLKGTKAKKL